MGFNAGFEGLTGYLPNTSLLSEAAKRYHLPAEVVRNWNMHVCRSQWPRGLRRRSTAARLLRLWVRIPPGGHGCFSLVSVVCCQVEVFATS